jgi:hypothetical protein
LDQDALNILIELQKQSLQQQAQILELLQRGGVPPQTQPDNLGVDNSGTLVSLPYSLDKIYKSCKKSGTLKGKYLLDALTYFRLPASLNHILKQKVSAGK